jgi:hypothetical protein
MKRKMLGVGPWVAADSESNLRTFRFVGAPRVESARFPSVNRGLAGNVLVAVSAASAMRPCAFGDNEAAPGLRHRRQAPESA